MRHFPLEHHFRPHFAFEISLARILLGGVLRIGEAAWGLLADMHNYHECFNLDPQQTNYPNSDMSPRRSVGFYTDGIQDDPCGKTLAEGEITADPRFVDIRKLDLRLRPDSRAIDAGIDLGYTEDYADTEIPEGDAPDIGAFEYVKPQRKPVSDAENAPAPPSIEAEYRLSQHLGLCCTIRGTTKALSVWFRRENQNEP